MLKLQSSLDVETVIELFREEVRRLVPFSKLTYRTADGKVVMESGQRGRYQVVYGLSIRDGEALGDLRFARERAFTDAELHELERAVGLLQVPLRNALRYREAVAMSRCDGLTGLFNRKAFDESLAREVKLSKRHREPLSLLMLDVNDFKRVNDVHGHRAGDAVLRRVAEVMRQGARESDLLFRYAGDEFVMLASHTDEDGAEHIARRIMQRLAGGPDESGDSADSSIDVTVSIGTATLRRDESAEAFFDRADAEMYQAKQLGRPLTH
ncbi:MAG TPA: GGDEF domain-containing protein [Gammaproteobacteria bacterium]|nr:GGDEF domain-containing protein [Gammaproteobacteria bacterium]